MGCKWAATAELESVAPGPRQVELDGSDGVSGSGTYSGSSGPVGVLFLNGSLSNPGKKR